MIMVIAAGIGKMESGLRFSEAEQADLPAILSIERLNHWKTLAAQPKMREWRVRVACPLPVSDQYAALLHEYNSTLSYSLLASLQILEISLRNHMHDALTEKYKSSQWWGKDTSGRIEPSDMILGIQRESVQTAIRVSSRRRKGITSGGVVSELSFGFWLALFNTNYNVKNKDNAHMLWDNCFDKLFNKRGPTKREVIFEELNSIVSIRNKCAHHDAIVALDVLSEYRGVISFARRFSKTTADWIDRTSLVPHILQPDWLSALRVSGRLIGMAESL
jgi:hypothetical protein